MEKASLIFRASRHDRCLYGRIDIEFYLGLAVVERYGGPAEQGKVQLTGFIKHPLGFVPTGGEVLVVKDRHRAFAVLDTPDDLLLRPPARIVLLPFELGMVIPVFSDQDNPIHRKFLSPERGSFRYCAEDRNAFRFADFLT